MPQRTPAKATLFLRLNSRTEGNPLFSRGRASPQRPVFANLSPRWAAVGSLSADTFGDCENAAGAMEKTIIRLKIDLGTLNIKNGQTPVGRLPNNIVLRRRI